MSEIKSVELIRVNPGNGKFTGGKTRLQISKNDVDKLGWGGEGSVTRVTVPDRKSIKLAYKEFKSEGNAQHALTVWKELKKAKVPVPQTFRLVEKEEKYTGILMTDLTRGWKDILISFHENKKYILQRVLEINPELVRKFALLDLRDPEVQRGLDEEASDIASKTAKNKIVFQSHDVVSCVFNHTGRLHLVVSDMGNIRLNSQEPYDTLFQRNQTFALMTHGFVEDAQWISWRLLKL